MVAVTLRVVAHPHKRDELLRTVRETLVEPTRAEPGCLTYRFYRDVEDENAFSFVEEWQDWDALYDHFRSDHVARFLGVVGEMLAEAPVGRFHEIEETRGMEAIDQARAGAAT